MYNNDFDTAKKIVNNSSYKSWFGNHAHCIGYLAGKRTAEHLDANGEELTQYYGYKCKKIKAH